MKPTILFDIDGTLAVTEHRRYLLRGKSPNWDKFNNLMGEDKPNIPIVKLYNTLWDSGEYHIVLISGRSEEFRLVTESWLTWNAIPFSDLLMRPLNDDRADEEIKKAILGQLKKDNHKILFVVDDRKKVVDMWRQNGVTCLQCDYGDF
jgi:hypothetical protein